MQKAATTILTAEISAPGFRLKDTNSNYFYSFKDLSGNLGTLVIFISNNCIFSKHALDEILMIANDYRVQGIGVMAISSNDAVQSPLDRPEEMSEFAFRNKIDFPYLYDADQQVAKSLNVKYTPDFYLFDKENQLFYHGPLDDSLPGNGIPSSGTDLRGAIDALLYNRSHPSLQKSFTGTRIIWK